MPDADPIEERIAEVEALVEGWEMEVTVLDNRTNELAGQIEDVAISRDEVVRHILQHKFLLQNLYDLQNKTKPQKSVTRKTNGKQKNVRGPLLDWRPLYQALPTNPEDALPVSILRDIIDDETLAEKNRHKFRDQLVRWEKHGIVRRKKTGTRTTSWYRVPANNGNPSH